MVRTVRLLVLAGAVSLLVAISCKAFNVPNEICDGSGVDAKRMLASGDGDCTRCMEDHCCDDVGACANAGNCSDLVRQAHECVITGPGAAAEREVDCTNTLPSPSVARDTYRCMRDQCGNQCGLPVCKVTPAATLFRNPQCDKCLAGACCAELDLCYGSRACKLSLECISQSCGAELGAALDQVSADKGVPDPARLPDGATLSPCTEPGASMFKPECVRKCLCDYQGHDQGLPPEDAGLDPFILAKQVFECAGRAKCGQRCVATLEAGAR